MWLLNTSYTVLKSIMLPLLFSSSSLVHEYENKLKSERKHSIPLGSLNKCSLQVKTGSTTGRSNHDFDPEKNSQDCY